MVANTTRRAGTLCLLLIAGISLWGCASASSTEVKASASPEFELESTPTASQAFRIAVEPRGKTGWTGDLPLVSPEGDRMAITDPERPSDILIRSIPNNRLDDPMVLGRVPGPIRFGRSVDESGFAVMDGERVGRASWVGGAVEWFAEQNASDLDLGPDNRIAFIQNGELVVRTRPPHCAWKMTPQLGMAPDGKGRAAFFFVGVFVMALWTLSAFGLMWKTRQLYAAPHSPSALLNLVVRLPPLPPPAPFDNLMPPNRDHPGASSGIRRVNGFGFGNRPTPFLIFQQECSPLFPIPTIQGLA